MPDRYGNIPIRPPQSSSLKKRTRKPSPSPVVKPPNDQAPARIKLWGWAVGTVLLFALYSCLGFLGVPYYLSEILPKKFKKETGMVLQPTGIKFNPLTFRLQSEKVQVLSTSPTPLISLKSFVTDLAPLSLLRRDLVSNTVTIDELNLNLVRELDGSYNIQKLLGDKKVSNASKIMDFSDLPFFFSLNNITVKNSTITFNDSPAGKTHTIDNIQLALPTFSNIPFQADQYLRPRFSAVIDGSPVELTGQALMGNAEGSDQATNLSCDIQNLNLSLYSGYLPFNLPFEIAKGKADGKVQLNFNPQEKNGNKLSIGFDLQISGAKLQSDNQSVVIEAPSARISGKLLPVSRLLVLDNIALRGPEISSYGESLSQNVGHILQQKKYRKTPDALQVNPFHLIADLLIVDDGTVKLFKKRQDESPSAIWNSLQLSVKKYTTKSTNARGQNYGLFRVSGEKKGTAAYFSWQGTLPTPESLKGLLTLVKIDSSDLLNVAEKTDSFQIQGVADLNGQLSINLTENTSPAIDYKLTDTELSIEDFRLIDNDTAIVEVPLVKFQGFHLAKGIVDFGNVSLKNAAAQFPYGSIPEPFSLFSSGRYQVQGFEFTGKTKLGLSSENSGHLIFSNLSVKANELNTPDIPQKNFSLNAETSSGGVLKAQGIIKLTPFSLSVTTGFRGLLAKEVLPFFSRASLLHNIEGTLSGKGSFSLPNRGFAGDFQLTDGSMKISENSLFSWNNTFFQGVQYSSKPYHLEVVRAEISHGDLGWQITDAAGDPLQQLATFFQNSFPRKEHAGEKELTLLPVDIQEIIFSNTRVHIQDHRLKPKWVAEVADFTGKIQDVHTTDSDSTSTVTFTGVVDDSPFTGQGEIDLFSKEENGKIHFTLENYPLASFHEQLSPRLDVDTSIGEFDLTLDSKWQEKQYNSFGFLRLTDVEPVSTNGLSALPLALLTGSDSTCRLNFDLSRSAPVGKTVLFEELLTLFQTLIVKGSVSPLLLATGDFTDLIGNEFIEFKPGQFMISDQGREVLTRFTALLIAHPYLGLELSGGIDMVSDKNSIREQLEDVELKRVENENQKLFKKWQTEKKSYEKRLSEQRQKVGANSNSVEPDIPGNAIGDFIPLQPEPVVIHETMLVELALKRLEVLHQHFTTQLALEPERIAIAQPNVLAVDTDRPANGVIITLKPIDR